MRRNYSMLEHRGPEKRVYELHFRPDAPLGEIYDVLSLMKKYIKEQMNVLEKKEEGVEE